MLIILEGADCAGKSTTAADIAHRLRVEDPDCEITILHKGPPTLHPLDEYVTPLLTYRPDFAQHIICDRWHWGEMVYPAVMNRKTKMDDAIFDYIELFILSRGGITVLLDRPLRLLQHRIAERGDDYVHIGQLDEIKASFRSLRTRSTTGGFFVVDEPTPDSIIALARGMELRAVKPEKFITPVGHWTPEVMFLGDTRNCRGGELCHHRGQRHPALGTAFMPYAATSGHFLFSSLVRAPKYSAFANACDVDDVVSLWNEYSRPEIVALGVTADHYLNQLSIRHAAAPHPQLVRRFHHSAMSAYGTLLVELIGTERNELKWRPSQDVPAKVFTQMS